MFFRLKILSNRKMENENNSINGQGIKRKYSDDNESRSVLPKYGNNENNQDQYDSLPEDVLIRIIKYLPLTQWPDMERVDQKFQRLTHSAWRGLRKIRLTEDFITNQTYDPNEILKLILEKLLNRSPYLISISDFGFYSGNESKAIDENVFRLLTQFQHLERLSIIGKAAITVTDLAQFLEKSKCRGRLKELDVNIYYESDEAQAQLLTQAFGNIPDRSKLKLEKFSIKFGIESESEDASPPSFNFFDFLNVIDADLLTKLNVLQCDIISSDLARLINRCLHLENFAFTFGSIEICQQGHSDLHRSLFQALMVPKNLSVLSMGFSKLKSHCDDCHGQICTNSLGLFVFFGLNRRIKQLSLYDVCYDGVIVAVENISIDLINLTTSLKGTLGESVMYLIPKLVNLKKLRIIGSVLSHSGADYDVLSELTTSNKQLECLYLDDFMSSGFNILTKLENLRQLHIRNSYFQSSTFDFWTIYANWKLESLAVPNYGRSNRQGTRAENLLLSFLTKMKSLHYLDLSANEIMDNDLETIVKICPFLIELKLNDCKLITIDGVQKIIDGCADLKRIEIPFRIRGLKVNKYRNIKFFYNDTSIDERA